MFVEHLKNKFARNNYITVKMKDEISEEEVSSVIEKFYQSFPACHTIDTLVNHLSFEVPKNFKISQIFNCLNKMKPSKKDLSSIRTIKIEGSIKGLDHYFIIGVHNQREN